MNLMAYVNPVWLRVGAYNLLGMFVQASLRGDGMPVSFLYHNYLFLFSVIQISKENERF